MKGQKVHTGKELIKKIENDWRWDAICAILPIKSAVNLLHF